MTEDEAVALLGVRRGADVPTVKKAYRKLAFEHHPDTNPNDAAATRRMADLNVALDLLTAQAAAQTAVTRTSPPPARPQTPEQRARTEAEERQKREATQRAWREESARSRRAERERDVRRRRRRQQTQRAAGAPDAQAGREAEERARRAREQETVRRAEEQRLREAEEEARRKADAEAARLAEEERLREAEQRARREAEAEAIRREAEAEAARLAEEERLREAEQRARREAEAEAIRRADQQHLREAEERLRRAAEAEARDRHAEPAWVRRHEAEWARQQQAELARAAQPDPNLAAAAVDRVLDALLDHGWDDSVSTDGPIVMSLPFDGVVHDVAIVLIDPEITLSADLLDRAISHAGQLDVPYAFVTNGEAFRRSNLLTRTRTHAMPMSWFPTPDKLRNELAGHFTTRETTRREREHFGRLFRR